MKTSRHQHVARRKRRIERRLRPRTWSAEQTPMYRASGIQYEHSERVRGLASGGIGAMHQLAQHTEVVDAIDRHVKVLKVALPYHEWDHVLGLAYNVLCVRRHVLAEHREPLFLVNRSGNRPSAEGAAERFDQARTLCQDAGFRRITFRGDTDFSQTGHLDRWNDDGVRFVFGEDARANLIGIADALS